MPFTDCRGVPVSSNDGDAVARLDVAVDALLAHSGSASSLVDALLAADPDCVAGHCLRAALLMLAGDGRRPRALEGTLAAIARRRRHAHDRERRHAAAAAAWRRGDVRGALRIYGALLDDYPRDAVALRLAHALDFRLGHRTMLRDRVARVLPHWDAGVPGYAHVLAMHAFGLEESGEYASAEATARHALELDVRNPAAVHTVAHVMEMQGRAQEGVEWLGVTSPIWNSGTGFTVHNAWHLALFHLDLDDTARALAIYDADIRPGPDAPTPTLVDASALLWRLGLRGVDTGSRLHALAACWNARPLAGERGFNLVHAMMAFAAAGWRQSARFVRRQLDDVARLPREDVPDAGLARKVCDAFEAFADRRYATAAAALARLRHVAQHCGGSVAQCDLIRLTLLEAALRGRSMRLARTLALEGVTRRPGSRLSRWLLARASAAVTGT